MNLELFHFLITPQHKVSMPNEVHPSRGYQKFCLERQSIDSKIIILKHTN
jgi:hypothetical protein